MFHRRLTASMAALAVIVSGLFWGASTANAGITGATILPASAVPGVTQAFTITVATDGSATSGFTASPEWDWPVSYGALTTDTVTAGPNTLTCVTSGVVFTAVNGTWSTGASACTYTDGGTYDPANHIIELTGAVADANTTSITVFFPSGVVTPQQSARGYGIFTAFATAGGQKQMRVSTTVDSDEEVIPLITLRIDANGGTCKIREITGYRGAWDKAPTAADCNGPGVLTGFNTKADGTGLMIAPGGNLNLTSDNTLYAQWETPRLAGAPTDVVATAGFNSIKVTWKAPIDTGNSGITNYLVQATPGGSVCISRLTDVNILECSFRNLNPGSQYTFKVQALNQSGWGGQSTASNSTSPWDLRTDTVEREKNKILFLTVGGSKLTVNGRAPGYAPGTVITPQLKIGDNGAWVSETRDLPKVPDSGPNKRFTWTKKLNKSLDKKSVEVRFVIGDATSNPMRANVDSSVGFPSAPRDVKVTSTTSGIRVDWKAPAKNGGSPITGYSVNSNLAKFSCVERANSTSCTKKAGPAFAANKLYTFTVDAKTIRGTGPEATATWKGEVYSLKIAKASRVKNSQGAGQSVELQFESAGFGCSAKFNVQMRVGLDGTWNKQGGSAEAGSQGCGSGTWTYSSPASVGGQPAFFRLQSPNGFSNEVQLLTAR